MDTDREKPVDQAALRQMALGALMDVFSSVEDEPVSATVSARCAEGTDSNDVEQIRSPGYPAAQDKSLLGTGADERFALVRELGRGGFGAVFEAEDRVLNRRVALKRVCLRGRASTWESLLAEARSIAALDHLRIVPIYDVVQSGPDCLLLVCKFIEGEDLAATMRNGRLSWLRAAQIARQIAEALAHAHRAGIYHRDVKPANILLDAQGDAFLVDFGLAVAEPALPAERDKISGTLHYMAPEQARGESHCIDGRTDVYALGIVLYEMCSGQRPFADGTQADVLEQIRNREPRPPRQIDPKIPEDLESIILRAISKSITQRYATADAMSRDLSKWMRQQERPGKWLRSTVVLSVVLTAVCLGVFVWNGIHPEAAPKTALLPAVDSRSADTDHAEWQDGDWLRDRDLRMRIKVWQGSGETVAPCLLTDGLPLVADRDYLRIECEVPPEMHLRLVWLDAEGKWHALDPVRDHARAEEPWKPTRTPARFCWPDPDHGEMVGGPGGTEAIFALVSSQTPPENVDDLNSLGDAHLPALGTSELIVLTQSQVQLFQSRSPTGVRRVVKDVSVEKLRSGLSSRCERLVGVVFPLSK